MYYEKVGTVMVWIFFVKKVDFRLTKCWLLVDFWLTFGWLVYFMVSKHMSVLQSIWNDTSCESMMVVWKKAFFCYFFVTFYIFNKKKYKHYSLKEPLPLLLFLLLLHHVVTFSQPF